MARCLGRVRSVLNPDELQSCPYEALWGDRCYWHEKVRDGLIRDYPVGREMKAVANGGPPPKDAGEGDALMRLLAEWDLD